ncbi:MAG: TonB-dependent receptor plug domain-containing protein, partial [Arenicellales bacterium]
MVVTVSAAAQTDPVVVTATRTAQTVDSSLASVSVIDRKQIETLQPETVAELLGTVPGVMVSQTGGLGQPTAVFLRGSETDHVLVLIDGVKVGSATLGATAFQFIDPDQIERIEIVRGPRSSLYGSDAIGGVIQ